MSNYKIYIQPTEELSEIDYEIGELGNPKPKKVVPPKPTFTTNVLKLGQSTNVIDNRIRMAGRHAVRVTGYLTWNTWFHLRTNVESGITNALRMSAWFDVFGVNVTYRDTKNSQYSFELFLTVENRFSQQQIISGIINILETHVALKGSIRILYYYDAPTPKF